MTIDEWASIGTLAAVLFAVVVYVQDRWEKRSDQAAFVSAWLATEITVPQPPARVRSIDTILRISNRSDQPVFDIAIWSTLMPIDAYPLAVLPPGDTFEMRVGEELLPPDVGSDYSARLALQFRDARGRKWRHIDGRLRRWFGFPRREPRVVRMLTAQVLAQQEAEAAQRQSPSD